MTQLVDEYAVLNALPALQDVWNAGRLGDYFTKKTAPLKQVKTETVERKLLKESIFDEVARLYGTQTAQEILEQLNYFPVVETGTHLAFMRDTDGTSLSDLRSCLNQNVLISGALMRNAGQKYHIGVYGSNVTLNHSCSGGFFQLGSEIFPVTILKNVNQYCLYQAPSIKEEFFNPTLKLITKLRMLSAVLADIHEPVQGMPVVQKVKKLTEQLLGPVKDFKSNYKAVQYQFDTFSDSCRIHIESAFEYFEPKIKEKFGYDFADIEAQYQALDSVFSRKELSLPEQVALVQSSQLNQLFEGTGMHHVSVDAVEVVRQFFIKSLQEPTSFWSRVFSNKEKFNQFQKAFVGIRSSWKEDESPFDVALTKEFCKIRPLKRDIFDHSVEKTIELLKNKEIVASSALMMLSFQSAGILAHGGFFQTKYAKEIQNQFQSFLKTQNEPLVEANVNVLESDTVLLSLSVLNGTDGRPLKLSTLARGTQQQRLGLMNMIPNYATCAAVKNALPVLSQYLDSTAPGYIPRDIQLPQSSQLICHRLIVPKAIASNSSCFQEGRVS